MEELLMYSKAGTSKEMNGTLPKIVIFENTHRVWMESYFLDH